MKNFFTTFFASLSALVVFCLGGLFLGFLCLLALAAIGGSEQPTAVEAGSYLVVDLSVNLTDTPNQAEGLEEFAEIFGGESQRVLQLRAATRAIRAAARDGDIKGIFLHGNFAPLGYGTGLASLKELRESLADFRQAGKPIKAYLAGAMTRDYYVASVADEVSLDPYGAIYMPGLASQPMFLTGAFEKFGLGVQVTRVGKYKSAVEPYTEKEMTPESRLQTQKLLDDLWAEIVVSVETSRQLQTGSLQKIVDTEGLLRAESALRHKFVDRTTTLDVVLDELKAATGNTGKHTFKQIALKDYARLVGHHGPTPSRVSPGQLDLGSSDKIAIIYAEGEIIDGTGHDPEFIWGQKLARQLRTIRQDSEVKAIVLRVNSPGGSVTASEAIRRELQLLQQQKPVVVSMGTYAASGGYWIATASDRIFAEPTTITGSIGVYGMFLNVQGLAEDKLGLTFDIVKTGRFADALTIVRPKTEAELALFQNSVDWVYEQFLDRVASARKLDRAVVQEIAQGRVWSGREALKLGLVDELGGLDAAVRHAATKAGLGENYAVAEFPQPKQFAEMLAEAFDRSHREYSSRADGELDALARRAVHELKVLTRLNDPQHLYARLPLNVGVN